MTTSNADDEPTVDAVLPLLLLLLFSEPAVPWRLNFVGSLLEELPDSDPVAATTPLLPNDDENDLRSDWGFSRSAVMLGIFEILVVVLYLLSLQP